MYYKKLILFLFIIYYILLGIFCIDFSKFTIINLGRLPLLPTELLLFIWLPLFLFNFNNYPFYPIVFIYFFYLLIHILLIELNTLLIIRIIVPFFYILFSYLTFDIVQFNFNIRSLEKLTKIVSVIAFFYTIILLILGLKSIHTSFETSTEGVYYLSEGATGIFFLQFFFSFSNLINRKNKIDILLFSMVIIWFLFFALHRSSILALLLPCIILYKREISRKIILIIIIIIISYLLIIFFTTVFIYKFEFNRILYRIYTIIDQSNDPNIIWRKQMWETAIKNLLNNPLNVFFGVGFKFYDFELTYEITYSLTKAPFEGFHNSLLFILFRIGIIGFFILTLFFSLAIRIALTNKRNEIKPIVAAFFAMIIFASFNVVFENPYHGFYLWFTHGFILGYLRKENLL